MTWIGWLAIGLMAAILVLDWGDPGAIITQK